MAKRSNRTIRVVVSALRVTDKTDDCAYLVEEVRIGYRDPIPDVDGGWSGSVGRDVVPAASCMHA